mgnify:FL=1
MQSSDIKRITLQETSRFSSTRYIHYVDVADLNDLQRALKQLNISAVVREWTDTTDDRGRIGHFVNVDQLSQVEWDWLMDEQPYESRSLAYES